MDATAVQQMIQQLLAQSVQEGLLDDQFLQLIQLQVGAGPCRRGLLGVGRFNPSGASPTAGPPRSHPPQLPALFPPRVLQDESNPDFVAEVVELYFEDSASKIDTLQARLAEPAPSYPQARAWGGRGAAARSAGLGARLPAACRCGLMASLLPLLLQHACR